jgi:hypothetical protein
MSAELQAPAPILPNAWQKFMDFLALTKDEMAIVEAKIHVEDRKNLQTVLNKVMANLHPDKNTPQKTPKKIPKKILKELFISFPDPLMLGNWLNTFFISFNLSKQNPEGDYISNELAIFLLEQVQKSKGNIDENTIYLMRGCFKYRPQCWRTLDTIRTNISSKDTDIWAWVQAWRAQRKTENPDSVNEFENYINNLFLREGHSPNTLILMFTFGNNLLILDEILKLPTLTLSDLNSLLSVIHKEDNPLPSASATCKILSHKLFSSQTLSSPHAGSIRVLAAKSKPLAAVLAEKFNEKITPIAEIEKKENALMDEFSMKVAEREVASSTPPAPWWQRLFCCR